MRTVEEISKEYKKRERLLQRMKKDCFYPSNSCDFMEAYISALRWVLRAK